MGATKSNDEEVRAGAVSLKAGSRRGVLGFQNRWKDCWEPLGPTVAWKYEIQEFSWRQRGVYCQPRKAKKEMTA